MTVDISLANCSFNASISEAGRNVSSLIKPYAATVVAYAPVPFLLLGKGQESMACKKIVIQPTIAPAVLFGRKGRFADDLCRMERLRYFSFLLRVAQELTKSEDTFLDGEITSHKWMFLKILANAGKMDDRRNT